MLSHNSNSERKQNRLSGEKSPYLLQHADNPVDWRAWNQEALDEAKEQDKPIFLSVGYATCHWCHVMAHESFEDEEVARLLNEYFIPVKVDREERPDIDNIYMTACQTMTGTGGWPLSVFLFPDGIPFYAGTYFPKTTRFGRPGFIYLLNRIHELWQKERDKLAKTGRDVLKIIKGAAEAETATPAMDVQVLNLTAAQLQQAFDPAWGGFGRAPKFPTPHQYSFLLRQYSRSGEAAILEVVEKSLQAMRAGGIFDHLGLGFARYSVDEKWLVPHFEKMLYDQALLAIAFLETYQVSNKEFYLQTAREIFTYVLRDMTSQEGGFYSAEDADSEGREGLFYVWRPQEIIEILGSDRGERFCRFYGVTAEGNFEDGMSVLHTSQSIEAFAEENGVDPQELAVELAQSREELYAAREKRVHPLKDDKILTAWNGLMIAALSKGYQICGDEQYLQAAEKAVDFIYNNLLTADGGFYRRFRQGEAAHSGYLEDYAFLVWGLIELYEASFNLSYLEKALELTRIMIQLFWDHEGGGFFFSGSGNEKLIAASKEIYDGATPSGNSVAALNLLRLARITGDTELEDKFAKMNQIFSGQISQHPVAFTHFMQALDFAVGPTKEIVVVGDLKQADTQAMIKAIQRRYLPRGVYLHRPLGAAGEQVAEIAGFTKEMDSPDGEAMVYICSNFACGRPVKTIEDLEAALIEA